MNGSKRTINRFLSALLIAITLFSTVMLPGLFPSTTASAASVGLPSVSSSSYLEMVLNRNINAYCNSACTVRGSCSPYKRYNSAGWKNDIIYVYSITSSYCQASMPTSSGRKIVYFKTSDLFYANSAATFTASTSANVYKTFGGSYYGYVAKGDRVYNFVTMTSGSCKQHEVIYTARSGNRAYKLGWVNEADYNKLCSSTGSSQSSIESQVQARLDSIANGSLKYNSWTVMSVGNRFTGTNSNEQCKGYMRNCLKLLYGFNVNSTQPNKYQLYSSSSYYSLGSYYSSASNYKSLFSKCKPGYFTQMKRKGSGGPHSAIVYSVSSSGVTLLEANTDGRNTVMKNYYTWDQLASKNLYMTAYAPSSYKLV